ncbi:MAG: colicin immunity domain-containing protein [Candidatus Melainabacteria bacterium]
MTIFTQTQLISTHFIPLLKDFVSRKLPIDSFETLFLETWHQHIDKITEDALFDILNSFFWDMEAYSPNAKTEQRPDEIGEAELRKRCQITLEKLGQQFQIASN